MALHTQVVELATTAVRGATCHASCASGSVEGFRSTVCTVHKHFLILVCSAIGVPPFFSYIMIYHGCGNGPPPGSVGRYVPVLAAADASNSSLRPFLFLLYGRSKFNQ